MKFVFVRRFPVAASGSADDRVNVFISYSRDDLAFADQLDAALRLHKLDVVFDRKGISGGEAWQPRLGALIRDADTVAFVLSPASAASPVCKWEVAEATRLGKRIIPVLCRRGMDLYPPWGEQPVFVTASHNYYGDRPPGRETPFRIEFPALKHRPHVALGKLLWVTPEILDRDSEKQSADTAVFNLLEKLPPDVQPIASVSDLDVTHWPHVKFLSPNDESVEGSVLDRVLPLITLGGVMDADPQGKTNPQLRLTMSLANALGRDQAFRGAKAKIVATDSTTMGSSGSPIFDANDGRLVGMIQYGTIEPKMIKAGLSYSGGTTIRVIKEAILSDAATAVDSSRKMFRAGNVDLGEMYLAIARTRDPSVATPMKARAEGYLKRGAAKLEAAADAEAVADFAIALKDDPSLASRIDVAWSKRYAKQGGSALENGKVDEADALFQQAERKAPDNAKAIQAEWETAYVERGASLVRDGKVAEADALFQQARRRWPDDAKSIDAKWEAAYIKGGRRLLRDYSWLQGSFRMEGTTAEADALFERAQRNWPNHAKSIDAAWEAAYVERGENLMRGGHSAEADALFQQAERKWPDYAKSIDEAWAKAHLDRGLGLVDQGGVADSGAEAELRRALELDPGAAHAWAQGHLERGRGRLNQDDDVEAQALFAVALKYDPTLGDRVNLEWAEALSNRARTRLSEGKRAEAEALRDRALKYDADRARFLWADALSGQIRPLLDGGKDAAAESASREAVAYDPRAAEEVDGIWADGYVRRGTDMLSAGDEAAAKAQFALARSRAGDDAGKHLYVRRDIARAWLRHGKPEAGLPDADVYFAAAGGSDKADAAQLRGLIYLALGRPVEASAHLDQAITKWEHSPVAHFARGQCRELLGDQAAAIDDYQAALVPQTWDQDERDAQEQARARLEALGVEPRIPPARGRR
jgi:Tfp pilus assembly protein PilF